MQSALGVYEHSWDTGLADAPTFNCPLYIKQDEGLREAPSALILACARRLIASRFHPGTPVLGSPDMVREFLFHTLASHDQEVFAVLFLDRRNRLKAFAELFRGTIDRVIVHPREVAREAIERNAASVILVRNDPSGCTEPTESDEEIGIRLREALTMLDVAVLDYYIVGENVISLAELGHVFLDWTARFARSDRWIRDFWKSVRQGSAVPKGGAASPNFPT